LFPSSQAAGLPNADPFDPLLCSSSLTATPTTRSPFEGTTVSRASSSTPRRSTRMSIGRFSTPEAGSSSSDVARCVPRHDLENHSLEQVTDPKDLCCLIRALSTWLPDTPSRVERSSSRSTSPSSSVLKPPSPRATTSSSPGSSRPSSLRKSFRRSSSELIPFLLLFSSVLTTSVSQIPGPQDAYRKLVLAPLSR
jgi:hypothetical protein